MSKRKKTRKRLERMRKEGKLPEKVVVAKNATTNETSKTEEVKETNEEKGKKKVDLFFPILILVVIASYLFNLFLFQLAFVSGSSMSPTMEHGQLLIINKVQDISEYQRGDVIIFDNNGTKLIKRLIAFPGETIQIVDNKIYINGEKIDDYVDVEMQSYGILEEPVTLKSDEYIFLGDNRNNSYDSREIGPIKTEKIVGRIIFRFWPLDTKF